MKTLEYLSSIKKCQYAIYPSYNILEPIHIKKKQVFERILTHLRNKYMSLIAKHSYNYHDLRADLKMVFNSLDVLNRSFELVLAEVDDFIVNRIKSISKGSFINQVNNSVNTNIVKQNNESFVSIKRVNVKAVNLRIPKKIEIHQKDKSPTRTNHKKEDLINKIKLHEEIKYCLTQIKRVEKVKHSEIMDSIDKEKLASKGDDQEKAFLNKIRDKYIYMGKNDSKELNKRIKIFNQSEIRTTESDDFLNRIKKFKHLSPLQKLKINLKHSVNLKKDKYSYILTEENI